MTQKEKELWDNGLQKYLILTFSDGTKLYNDSVSGESLSIIDSLCEDNKLTYGKVNGSQFEIKIKATTKRYKGLQVKVELSTANPLDEETKSLILGSDYSTITLGTFTDVRKTP